MADVSIRFKAEARQAQGEIRNFRGTLAELNKTIAAQRNQLIAANAEQQKNIRSEIAANTARKATIQSQIEQANLRKQAITELAREARERERAAQQQVRAAEQQVRAAERVAEAQRAAVFELTAGVRVLHQQFSQLTTGFVRSAADMETFRNSIQAVTGDSAETDRVLRDLLALTVELVGIDTGTLISFAGRLMAVGLSSDEAISSIRGVTERIAEQGKGAAVTRRILEQVSQSLNTGRAKMDDFRPILAEMPRLWEDVSNALGTNVRNLEEFNAAAESVGGHTQALVLVFEEMGRASEGANLDTLNAQFDIFQDQSNLLAAQLGEHLIPAIVAVLKQVNQWIEAFNNLDDRAQAAIAWAAALATGLTGLVAVAGTATIALGALNASLAALTGASGLAGAASAMSSVVSVGGRVVTTLGRVASIGGLAATAVITLADAWRQIYTAFNQDRPFEDAVKEITEFNVAQSETAKGLGITAEAFGQLGTEAAQDIALLAERADQLRGDIVKLVNAGADRSEIEAVRKEYRQIFSELETLYENAFPNLVSRSGEATAALDALAEKTHPLIAAEKEIQSATTDVAGSFRALTPSLEQSALALAGDTGLTGLMRSAAIGVAHLRSEIEGIKEPFDLLNISFADTQEESRALKLITDELILSTNALNTETDAQIARGKLVDPALRQAAIATRDYASDLSTLGVEYQEIETITRNVIDASRNQIPTLSALRDETQGLSGALLDVSDALDDLDRSVQATSGELDLMTGIFDTLSDHTEIFQDIAITAFDELSRSVLRAGTEIDSVGESLLAVSDIAARVATGDITALIQAPFRVAEINAQNDEIARQERLQRRGTAVDERTIRGARDTNLSTLARLLGIPIGRLDVADAPHTVQGLQTVNDFSGTGLDILSRNLLTGRTDIAGGIVAGIEQAIESSRLDEGLTRSLTNLVVSLESTLTQSDLEPIFREFIDNFEGDISGISKLLADAGLPHLIGDLFDNIQAEINAAALAAAPLQSSTRYNLLQRLRARQPAFGATLAAPTDDQERGLTAAEVAAAAEGGTGTGPAAADINTSLLRNVLERAQFAFSGATDEQDFEARRQDLIQAINAYYDEEARRIAQLMLSETELQNQREDNALDRQQALRSATEATNQFAEDRIRTEARVASETARLTEEQAREAERLAEQQAREAERLAEQQARLAEEARRAEAAAARERERQAQRDAQISVNLQENVAQRARFALGGATGETDFEARRQTAILATNAYYDAELERIQGLQLAENELQDQREDNELARQSALQRLTSQTNQFTADRIRAEEQAAAAEQRAIEETARETERAAADAAREAQQQAREAERAAEQAARARVEAERQAIAEVQALERNALQRAQFAFSGATDEQDFEARRQTLINAINAFYDAEEARINNLEASENRLRDLREDNVLARERALRDAEGATNRFEQDRLREAERVAQETQRIEERAVEERLREEMRVSDAISDLQADALEAYEDFQNRRVDLAERTAERIEDIETRSLRSLQDSRTEYSRDIQDLHTGARRDIVDLGIDSTLLDQVTGQVLSGLLSGVEGLSSLGLSADVIDALLAIQTDLNRDRQDVATEQRREFQDIDLREERSIEDTLLTEQRALVSLGMDRNETLMEISEKLSNLGVIEPLSPPRLIQTPAGGAAQVAPEAAASAPNVPISAVNGVSSRPQQVNFPEEFRADIHLNFTDGGVQVLRDQVVRLHQQDRTL